MSDERECIKCNLIHKVGEPCREAVSRLFYEAIKIRRERDELKEYVKQIEINHSFMRDNMIKAQTELDELKARVKELESAWQDAELRADKNLKLVEVWRNGR